MDQDKNNIIQEVTNEDYKWGFVTNIETDTIGKGLNEDVVRLISKKKVGRQWRNPTGLILPTRSLNTQRLFTMPLPKRRS